MRPVVVITLGCIVLTLRCYLYFWLFWSFWIKLVTGNIPFPFVCYINSPNAGHSFFTFFIPKSRNTKRRGGHFRVFIIFHLGSLERFKFGLLKGSQAS